MLQISSTLAVLNGVILAVIELQQNTKVSLLPANIYEMRQKSLDEPENLTVLEYRALESFYTSKEYKGQ